MEPQDRFGNRVKLYVKYRPSYPSEIIDILVDNYDLSTEHEVADIGAGVGHSAKLFTDFGCYTYGIEPNQKMYDALIRRMKDVPNFSARLQSAENTDLEGNSIDLIVCGQSYHWFDRTKTKTEFSRILKDDGVVVLMWNSWDDTTEFGKAYSRLVEGYSIDYAGVSRTSKGNKSKIEHLYSSYNKDTIRHSQYFDLEGLKGRYMSSSYALLPDMPGYDEAMQQIEKMFDQYSSDGTVEFGYICEVYHGRM